MALGKLHPAPWLPAGGCFFSKLRRGWLRQVFWLLDILLPRLPRPFGPVAKCGFASSYSGGTAPDLRGVPFSALSGT